MSHPPADIVNRHPRATIIEIDEDICIACGDGSKTPAHLYARYPSGRTAAFCAHHGTEQLTKLQADGCRIVDLRHRVQS